MTRDGLRNLPLLPLNPAPNPIRVQQWGWFSLQEKSLTYFYILITEEFCSCGPTHSPSACAAEQGITFGLKVPGLLLKARVKHSCCSSTTLICGDSILLPGEANPELDRLLHWSEKGHKYQCDRTHSNGNPWCPTAPSGVSPRTFAKLLGLFFPRLCSPKLKANDILQLTHEQFSYKYINLNID